MRATLLAIATATTFGGRRSMSPIQPRRLHATAAPRPPQHRVSADDEEPAQVGVAALGDAAQPLLAAARVLARDQSDPGRELAAGPELGRRRGTVAAISVALIGPMPGMLARRRLTSLPRCHAMIWRSSCSMRRSRSSSCPKRTCSTSLAGLRQLRRRGPPAGAPSARARARLPWPTRSRTPRQSPGRHWGLMAPTPDEPIPCGADQRSTRSAPDPLWRGGRGSRARPAAPASCSAAAARRRR